MKKGVWSSFWQKEQGFTLIELAVAVFVISILIAIALPNLRGAGEKAQQVTCEGNQRLLRAQLENYYLAEKSYPTGTSDTDRIQKMVDTKYLQTAPSCPVGGTYKITVASDGTSATVDCSKHGVLGQ